MVKLRARENRPSLTWMIEAVPGRALSGRGTFAVLGRVIGGIIGLDARILQGARVLVGVLGFFSLLASAARPATLQSREKRVCALRHGRRAVMMMTGLMPMMARLAGSIAPPRGRAVHDLVVAQLRGAFREQTTPVQI